jgi:hypothetical protein
MARKTQSGLETTTGVLEMKLGFCLTAPTKRAIADLHEIANKCNLVRNGLVRYWERWREDHPEWKPEQRRDRKGDAKVARKMKVEKPWKVKQVKDLIATKDAVESESGEVTYKGKTIAKFEVDPVLENPAFSQDLENEMYHRGCEIASNVGCSIIAQLRSEVIDRLKTRLPYNHPGSLRAGPRLTGRFIANFSFVLLAERVASASRLWTMYVRTNVIFSNCSFVSQLSL